MGRLVEVADTTLYVEERGEPSAFPLLVFHGGPGLDHTMFGDYLDPLAAEGRYRLVMVDERACGRSDRTAPAGTWTLGRMAEYVSDLAASLGISDGYATLGHSYGAFVVLQHAVDHPAAPRHDRVLGRGCRALAQRGRGAAGCVRAGGTAQAGEVVVGARD
jgi:proline iminopeptidase